MPKLRDPACLRRLYGHGSQLRAERVRRKRSLLFHGSRISLEIGHALAFSDKCCVVMLGKGVLFEGAGSEQAVLHRMDIGLHNGRRRAAIGPSGQKTYELVPLWALKPYNGGLGMRFGDKLMQEFFFQIAKCVIRS
jgi:hypothetical protein